MNKIRILWVSDLIVETGFSRVSHSIIKYLPKEQFEIIGLGVNYYGDPHKYGFDVYPTVSPKGTRDLLGLERIKHLLEKFKPDIIFILNDAWVLDKYLQVIKEHYKENPTSMPKIVLYFPVDSQDHEPKWYTHFDIATKTVVYTKFGKDVVKKAAPSLKTEIIPHGVDTEIFYKYPVSRFEVKKDIFRNKTELWDKFIILNANRNQPRKRLDLTLRAFQIFAKDKPDVRLYMHCGVIDSHLNISILAKRFNIDDKLILTNLGRGPQQIPVESLNLIYNTADIGVNSSLGEGWGLVNIEHAVTGAPQVVPANSANIEIYDDCGILINKGSPTILENMTTGYMTDPRKIAKGFEKLYTNKELYEELSKKSIEKFSSDTYSWKKISELWSSLFMEVMKND